jgi:FtsP/CotA-like multicopper oxidase with cupredoxin domain
VRPISRRGALVLGGLGAVGAVAGGAGLLWAGTSVPSPAVGGKFVQPAELRSVGGLLRVRLAAAPGRVQIGGRTASALGYNGSLPGPTLRLKPGDRLAVALHNGLGDPTNLHVHGLHVSPEGNGDNPFVMVEPGDSFDYEYRLPADHPPGVYWYHPHHHGFVADQVFGGLYGAIIVDDPEPIAATRERVLVVSDVTLDASGQVAAASAMDRMRGREGNLVLVNGQVAPGLAARPGDRERWRIVNACVSRYLRLRLDGQGLQLLGIDSGRLRSPRTVDEVLLAPGNRADLLVTAAEGSSLLRALPYDRGGVAGMGGAGSGSQTDAVTLASLLVSGGAAGTLPVIPGQAEPLDLRAAAVTARRELTFAMGAGGGMGGGMMMGFTINGREFDPGRVDTTVQAGSVEEWTLRNTSPMDHPVHLHVWPMQIVEEDGRAAPAALWQDVVNVPTRGTVVVRIAFSGFAGRTVYHCHILDHEDRGMMGVIEAVRGASPG